MKTFTEEEVDKLVRAILTESVNGVFEWIKSETDIIDTDTKKVIQNAEITLKPNSKGLAQFYINPRLVKHGIKFTNK